MITILATNSELELSGTPAELREVRDRLAGLHQGERLRIPADASAVAAPYDRTLAALEVVAADGPVHVSVEDDRLSVSGSPAMLVVFASFFDFDDSEPLGNHRHHEYSNGNAYIAADSRPLVICRA